MFYVYFAESQSTGKIYVGYTFKDPEKRVKEHNLGSNKFTKYSGPFNLIYFESYVCKTDAIRRESFYKMGFGKQIKKLIVTFLKNEGS